MLEVLEFPSGAIKGVSWLVFDDVSSEAVIIDLGGRNNLLIQTIKAKNLILKFILVTHAHHDHILGLGSLKSQFPNVKIYCNANDKYLWDDTLEYIEQVNKTRLLEIVPPPDYLEAPDVYFSDEPSFQLGAFVIETMHIPGHTPGGCLYWNRELNSVFIGDTLCSNGIGAMKYPGHDWKELKASFEKMRSVFNHDTLIYNSHTPTGKFGDICKEVETQRELE